MWVPTGKFFLPENIRTCVLIRAPIHSIDSRIFLAVLASPWRAREIDVSPDCPTIHGLHRSHIARQRWLGISLIPLQKTLKASHLGPWKQTQKHYQKVLDNFSPQKLPWSIDWLVHNDPCDCFPAPRVSGWSLVGHKGVGAWHYLGQVQTVNGLGLASENNLFR